MKVVICLLFIAKFIVCELPPPYPPRTFPPSSPITRYKVPNSQQFSQPQTVYGPPNNAEPLDPSFHQPENPAKLRSQKNNQRPQVAMYQRPPQRYLGPPKIVNTPSQSATQNLQSNTAAFPQTIYGPPKASNLIPQTMYGVPDRQITPQIQNNFAAYQPEPSRNYGSPNIDSATLEEIKQLRQLIQKIETQRIAQQASVSNNRHGESLPNKEASNFKDSLSEQYLHIKEPDNFKKDISLGFNRQQGARQNVGNQNSDHNNFNLPRENQPALPMNYLPSQHNNNQFNAGSQGFPANQPSNPANTGNSWNNLDLPSGTNSNVDIQKVEVTQFGPNRNIDNNNNDFSTTYRPDSNTNDGEINNYYIPPTTTENPTLRFPSTLRPSETSTPRNIYETPQDENTESPNIAIATSIVGAPNDQQYYLLHPDGRYQRIILPKLQDQTNKQNGPSTNYQLYQNLQVDPNVLYTPLYTVINK